jgi:hypothetical protein
MIPPECQGLANTIAGLEQGRNRLQRVLRRAQAAGQQETTDLVDLIRELNGQIRVRRDELIDCIANAPPPRANRVPLVTGPTIRLPPDAPALARMANDRTPCERASRSRLAPAPGGSSGRPLVEPGTPGGGRCRPIRPVPRSSYAPSGPSPHACRAAPPAGSPRPDRRHATHLDPVTHAATSRVRLISKQQRRSAPGTGGSGRFAGSRSRAHGRRNSTRSRASLLCKPTLLVTTPTIRLSERRDVDSTQLQ